MSPFDDSVDDVELFRQIVNEPLKFPNYPKLHTDCRDFISQLLIKDPTGRLGGKPDGSDGCINHPWLSTVNWDDIRTHQMKSPIDTRPYKQSEDKTASDGMF